MTDNGRVRRPAPIAYEKSRLVSTYKGKRLTDLNELSGRLFKMAETLWTNTALRPGQYAQPVLALIALRQMEAKFETVHAELRPTFNGRLKPTPADYQAGARSSCPRTPASRGCSRCPATPTLGPS